MQKTAVMKERRNDRGNGQIMEFVLEMFSYAGMNAQVWRNMTSCWQASIKKFVNTDSECLQQQGIHRHRGIYIIPIDGCEEDIPPVHARQ